MDWWLAYYIGIPIYYAMAWVIVSRKNDLTLWQTFSTDKCTPALAGHVFLAMIWFAVVPVVILAIYLDWQIKKIKKEGLK